MQIHPRTKQAWSFFVFVSVLSRNGMHLDMCFFIYAFLDIKTKQHLIITADQLCSRQWHNVTPMDSPDKGSQREPKFQSLFLYSPLPLAIAELCMRAQQRRDHLLRGLTTTANSVRHIRHFSESRWRNLRCLLSKHKLQDDHLRTQQGRRKDARKTCDAVIALVHQPFTCCSGPLVWLATPGMLTLFLWMYLRNTSAFLRARVQA